MVPIISQTPPIFYMPLAQNLVVNQVPPTLFQRIILNEKPLPPNYHQRLEQYKLNLQNKTESENVSEYSVQLKDPIMDELIKELTERNRILQLAIDDIIDTIRENNIEIDFDTLAPEETSSTAKLTDLENLSQREIVETLRADIEKNQKTLLALEKKLRDARK